MSEQEKDYPMYEVSKDGIKQVSCSACQSLRARIEGLREKWEREKEFIWYDDNAEIKNKLKVRIIRQIVKDLNSLLGKEKPKPERQVE